MFTAVNNTWSLLLGMLCLMIGNGIQSTLLGIRGGLEGFSTLEMSFVMSAYFMGFLGGARLTPALIRRVGHVRVFAALASFISAVLILFPMVANPLAWSLGRIIIGFCFCGVYVTAESWLNNAATNETRGQTLSAYMIVQMIGIVTAQVILTQGDPSGFALFVIPSVLVSISFAPILLSAGQSPAFERSKPMKLRDLMRASPLGMVGMFLLGGVFSAQFGMSAVFANAAGLSVSQVSIFVATFYVGATLAQFPLGWLSDRMDRRLLIVIVSFISALGACLGIFASGQIELFLLSAFIVGGGSNPLYSLLIAHTNDYLDFDDMASASGGLLFINGIGAIAGPIVTGWVMTNFGVYNYFSVMACLMTALAIYGLYRMTQRAAPSVEETSSYAPVAPTTSPILVEVAQEYAIEVAMEEQREDEQSQSSPNSTP